MNDELRSGFSFVHAQDDLNLCILCMFEGTVSPDATNMLSKLKSWRIMAGDGRVCMWFCEPFKAIVQRYLLLSKKKSHS